MTDPVEAALRAVEEKHLPAVMEGKSLMPMYPRGDVAIMVAAAVKAEREACAKLVDKLHRRAKDDWGALCDLDIYELAEEIRSRNDRD